MGKKFLCMFFLIVVVCPVLSQDTLFISGLSRFAGSGDICVVGDYCYTGRDRFKIFDISTRTYPVELGNWYTYFLDILEITVSGNYAYIVDEERFFRIIDVSDPYNPIQVGHVTHEGSGNDFKIFLDDTIAYITDEFNLLIFNVSDPTAPTEIYIYDSLHHTDHVEISGPYAYITDGVDEIIVLDISDPSAPVTVGSCIISLPGEDFDIVAFQISNPYLYIAGGFAGLVIVDIHDPVNPVYLSYHPTAGRATDVYIVDTLLYLADALGGLIIFDISYPPEPEWTAHRYYEGNYVIDVSGDGPYIYVLDRGAHIYEISTRIDKVAILSMFETPPDHEPDYLYLNDYNIIKELYSGLLKNGYGYENIYIMADTSYHYDYYDTAFSFEWDLNDDSFFDIDTTINFYSSLHNYVIDNWAYRRVDESTKVFIYLSGYGNREGILTGDEIYTPSDLFADLEALRSDTIFVLFNASNCGYFLPTELSNPGKCNIASCDSNISRIVSSIDFGSKIANKLSAGYDFATSFNEACDWACSVPELCPNPQIDDNGDWNMHSFFIPNEGDGFIAQEFDLGFNHSAKPHLVPPEIINFGYERIGDSIFFNLQISSNEPLNKALVYIIPIPPETLYSYCPVSATPPVFIKTDKVPLFLSETDSTILTGKYYDPDITDTLYMCPYIEDINSDYSTNIFSPYAEIEEIDLNKSDRFALQIAPNPFNSFCLISGPRGTKYKIFDLTGRMIYKTNENVFGWKPEKTISSGIYLLQAKMDNSIIATKKIVYLK